jgi:two-component system sensor histidine kinase QseC
MNSARPYSMRRQLLALLMAAVAVIWIGVAVASYIDARQEIDELLDAHLAQASTLLIAQAGHDLDEIDEHVPEARRYSRRVAFQFWEGGTRLRLRSSNAPHERLAANDEGFSDVRIDGHRWRVFSGWDSRHRYLVQAGERLGGRDEIVAAMARNLLLPLVVALPLLALLVWLVIERVLRPLRMLNREVAHRAPDHLAPIDVGRAPVEVAPLVTNLNDLFGRVHASMANERRFTADAAHELRTPLAALRAQAQVARGATDDRERMRALDNVLAGCDRAAHLVDQLLTLARLDPAHAQSAQTNVAFAPLVQSAIAEAMPAALEKDIEIALREDERVHVHGDARLLGILLRNLLDNAIRYSPPASAVDVEIGRDHGNPRVRVRDQGPGVPADARAQLGQRFQRFGVSDVSGTGLGLSIVLRVAELHGAQVAFDEAPGGGLAVTVTFPAAR